MVYSFDIFDTCLVRKCGTPENMLDVLSLRVFKEPVEERIRQEFVVARHQAAIAISNNVHAQLSDIYDAMRWTHPSLYPKEELLQIEMDCEKSLLVPVQSMLQKINNIRQNGNHIIFISDMYLPTDFLQSILIEMGFMFKEDSLYVSNAIGCCKYDGTLFEHIKNKENLAYRSWIHFGDNSIADYQIPRKYGIKANLIRNGYSPYEKEWIFDKPSFGFKYGNILAGLCRALRLSLPEHPHNPLLVDIGAPLFTTFVYRVLQNANATGIRKLFFCARDAKMLLLIANHLQPIFPQIQLSYLHISRAALYSDENEAKIRYFEQCGLASKSTKTAIVDLRTTGKTLCVLNSLLESHGYIPVQGYYLEMFCQREMSWIPKNFYSETQSSYLMLNPAFEMGEIAPPLIEMYFSVHQEKRTIGYRIDNDTAIPVLDEEEQTERLENTMQFSNCSEVCEIHTQRMIAFAQDFVELELFRYANELFTNITLTTLEKFCAIPHPFYLESLLDFLFYNPKTKTLTPYVRKASIVRLIVNKGKDSYWKNATRLISLPPYFSKLYALYLRQKQIGKLYS